MRESGENDDLRYEIVTINDMTSLKMPLAVERYRKSNRAEIMFDVLMTLLVILSFGFPVMPWFFGARWAADVPSSNYVSFHIV